MVKALTFVNNTRITSSQATQPTQPEDIEDSASDTTEPMSDINGTDINNIDENVKKGPTQGDDRPPPPKMYKRDPMGSTLTDTTTDMEINTQDTEFTPSDDEATTITNRQGTKIRLTTPNKQVTNTEAIDKSPTKSKPKAFNTLDPLPKYFDHVNAVLYGNFDPALKSLLFRYISAYAG
jgi:hypothetical protein